MLDKRSIFTYRDYGRLQFKLVELLKSRGMTRGRLAKLVDAKYSTIDRLYHGKTERIDCDVLARICFVLECELSDIMKYEKSPE